MNDNIILVDFSDREIGTCTKAEAHKLPALHRAFSVYLYRLRDGRPEMLIQKRAEGKYHSGGLWTNACCSHPRAGESLQLAVERRLVEELGIDALAEWQFSFPYYYRFSPDVAEYELDHVFLGEWNGGEPVPNPEEVGELRWISLEELEKWMFSEPDAFTPWFMTGAPQIFGRIWKRLEKGDDTEDQAEA